MASRSARPKPVITDVLAHPVLLLDVSLIAFGVALSNGWIVLPKSANLFLFTTSRSKRRWLRITGSAKRWTRVLRMLLGKQSNLDKVVAHLRHPIKSTSKLVQKLWQHRNKYSLLSDYSWWVNTTDINSDAGLED